MRTANVRFKVKGTDSYVEPVAIQPQVKMTALMSTYEGASQAPRLARWMAPQAGPNALATAGLATLRDRSRDMARNNGTADAALEAVVSSVIGTGIVPQFQTPDAELNKAMGQAFLEWTDEADADGRLDFYGLQAAAVRSMAEAGDIFTRLRVRRLEDGLSVPLQLQMIESEFCPEIKSEALRNGNTVRAGVEFNRLGQRVAYHLYREHPHDFRMGALTTLLETVAVPASEVVHMAAVRRPGMIRGEPWLTRAMVKLHDLDKYDDAQLTRQQVAALFAGFVTEEMPEDFVEEPGVLGQQIENGVAPLEPGTMQVLGKGRKVEFNEPPDPGNAYLEFMRLQQRIISASVGILYEQLTGDYSQVNDRTFRASVNEFRRRCAMWQHHLVVFQFCRPILRRWVDLAILAGRIRLPAGITSGAVARAKWVPQGWAYINPVQDVQARTAEVRAGFRSRREVVSEQGYDVEQIDEEIASDNERTDRLGIVLDSDSRTGGADETEEPQDPDNPDKR